MICSVFVFFFPPKRFVYKILIFKTYLKKKKKSKNLLVICGSPRPSDWLLPRWIAPVPPAMIAVPMTSSRSGEPCPRPEVTSDLWQMRRVHGFFPQRRNLGFLNWDHCALWAEFSVSSSESGFCFSWKRGKDSTPRTWTCQVMPARSCRHCSVIPDGSRKKQKPERRWSLPTPPPGRPGTKQIAQKK